MVKFDYFEDGRIAGVRDAFSAYNEPSGPIPDEVTALTGITDEMVAGHRIDAAAVEAFVDDAVIVIAHNSSFDRKFAERYWPIFEKRAWGCSATGIEWRKHSFEGAKLGYLLNGVGFFHHSIAPSTTAMRSWKFSRSNCRPRVRLRSPCCWRPLASRRCAYGPSTRHSNSKDS